MHVAHGPITVYRTPKMLTAALALARSSICRWRSSISTSMDLRALTAAAQVNSDSSSCGDTAQHPAGGREHSASLKGCGFGRVWMHTWFLS